MLRRFPEALRKFDQVLNITADDVGTLAQPENPILIGDLSLINVGLGDKATALALAKRGIAVRPIEKDALEGAAPIEFLAG